MSRNNLIRWRVSERDPWNIHHHSINLSSRLSGVMPAWRDVNCPVWKLIWHESAPKHGRATGGFPYWQRSDARIPSNSVFARSVLVESSVSSVATRRVVALISPSPLLTRGISFRSLLSSCDDATVSCIPRKTERYAATMVRKYYANAM